MFEPSVIQCRNVTSTFMPISVSSNREEETHFFYLNWHPSAPVVPADSLGKTYLIAAGGDGKCGRIFSQCSLKWRCCSGSFTPELFLSGVSKDVSLCLSFSLGESAASEAVLLLVYWTLKAKTHDSFLILVKYGSFSQVCSWHWKQQWMKEPWLTGFFPDRTLVKTMRCVGKLRRPNFKLKVCLFSTV